MNKISLVKIWALSKKNIQLYIKKGPVLIFGLMFPFFMVLSWVLGREISPYQVFVGIISMTAFFTSTAISPVVLPIETREKSLERLLSAPISIQNILLGIKIAQTLYSLINQWKDYLLKYAEDAPVLLIGNKKDIKSLSDDIIEEAIENLKRDINIVGYIETSALTNENLEKLYWKIIELAYEYGKEI